MATRSLQESVIFSITGFFEGEGYTERTGNFDGAGWSLGLLQWNFGQGTLQPLIKVMYETSPQLFYKCLPNGMADELINVIRMKPADAVKWADGKSVGEAKTRIVEPWRSALLTLLSQEPFKSVQRHFAQAYVKDAYLDCQFYGIRTLRGLALMFDVSVQNGQAKLGSNAKDEIKKLFAAKGGHALEYRKKLEALAQVAAETCNPKWKQVVLDRKMAIARGSGNVYGSFVDLDKKFGLNDEALA